MKDELPDLTAFLSKKGGNAQSKSAENPPEKTDLSSKLSALVKKPGGTMTNAPAVGATTENQPPAPPAAPAAAAPKTSWADLGASANTPISGSGTPWGDLSALGTKQPWSNQDENSAAAQPAPAQTPAIVPEPVPEPFLEAPPAAEETHFAQSASAATSSSAVSWDKVDTFTTTASTTSVAALEDSAFEADNSLQYQQPISAPQPAPDFSQAQPIAEPVESIQSFAVDSVEAQTEPVAEPASRLEPPAVADNRLSDHASASGTFSTSSRPLGSRAPLMSQPSSVDKFKAPQARPMSTLSSGPAPTLKAPDKPAAKPGSSSSIVSDDNLLAKPSTQANVSTPSSASLAQPAAPSASAGSANTASSSAAVSKVKTGDLPKENPEAKRAEVPPSWPAQPTAPPRIVEKAVDKTVEKSIEKNYDKMFEKPGASSSSSSRPSSVLSSLASSSLAGSSSDSNTSLSAVSNSLRDAPKKQESEAEKLARAFAEEAKNSQSEAEKLARAFQEEAKALEEGRSAEELSPAEAFAAAAEAHNVQSKYDIEEPSRGLGFGNLLGTNSVDTEPQRSKVADLMVPTGQQQAVFGRDRSDLSPFDEPTVQSNVEQSESTAPSFDNFAPAGSFDSQPPEPQSNGLASLFSSEIVTSGQDFSQFSRPESDAAFSASVEESEQPQAVAPEAQTDIFSQLMQAVSADLPPEALGQSQQHTQIFSRQANVASQLEEKDDFSTAGKFANQDSSLDLPASSLNEGWDGTKGENSYSSSEYEEDLSGKRTADEMFGAGGSSMGSDEELRAADAVFGGADQAQIVKPTSSSIDPLPMAFGDPTNFQQMRLEDIKLAKRAAKEAAKKAAEEAAKKAAAEEAEKIAAEPVAETTAAKAESTVGEVVSKQSLIDLIEKSNAAKLEKVQSQPKIGGGLMAALSDDDDHEIPDQPAAKASPKSTLSSLLAQANEPDEPEEEEDEHSLGGAISDAFDKLLGDAGVDVGSLDGAQKPASSQKGDARFAPSSSAGAGSGSGSGLTADFANEPVSKIKEPAAEIVEKPKLPEQKFAPTAQSAGAADQAMTGTQSKADALSRLLEVANKAPSKPTEEPKASDSASKLAELINKPPGKISRQMPGMDAADFAASGTSPFAGAAGSAPFTSPFGPSPAAANSQSSSSSSSQPAMNMNDMAGSGQRSGIPEAAISTDAVSARIAALNRKLEEQSKVLPSASRTNIDAAGGMSGVSLPPLPPQPSTGTATGTGTPSVNTLSQMPNLVDDSPTSRAELVNRILGSAKLAQQTGSAPELSPSRSMPEMPAMPEPPAAGRQQGQKGQKAREGGRSKMRGAQPMSFDPRIIVVLVLLIAIAGGGYWVISRGMIKIDSTVFDKKPTAEVKLTVDQLLKNGEFEKVIDTLEGKLKAGKITSSEQEKLCSAYLQKADKLASNDEESAAIKVLEKVPSKSKKYKEAQKLIRKLKKKVKKN